MNLRWLAPVLLLALLLGCRKAAPPTSATAVESTDTPSPTDTPLPTSTPTPADHAAPAAPLDPYAQAKRLGRGVNLGNALEAPREGEWGVVLQGEYFALIGEAGFDTVRVPIRWSSHALQEPPYTVDERFFERIDWVIENAFAQGLNVVINMHHYEEIFQYPGAHKERFLEIWRQIATRYRHMPDNLYLEPLNEPHDRLTAARWNDLLEEVIAVIREVDGVHTIVVDAAEWGNAEGLSKLRIPEQEGNVICSFHLYEPFLFTHQGAEWADDYCSTTGVQWPGPPDEPLEPSPAARKTGWVIGWFKGYNTLPYNSNPSGPRPILRDLDLAARYGNTLDRPLWLGEFGAYSKADMASRVRYTAFVRQEAEKRGIAWAYWEFGAGFGVYDRAGGRWNEGLLSALIPQD
jgi:endoglucanase